MIAATHFIDVLGRKGLDFFVGVPDSLLKSLSSALARRPAESLVVAANEGNAVGLAIGYYLASGRPAVVYMQNSGLGNAINPLTSLTDPEIYSIPLLLVVGWRGEPGRKDEPQHVKQGRITPDLLQALEIPFSIIDGQSDIEKELNLLWPQGKKAEGPAALLIREGTFAEAEESEDEDQAVLSSLYRERALECLLNGLSPFDCLVATTGKTGRELFELRKKRAEKNVDFLTVGGMGHGSSIALGLAMTRCDRRVVCIDGDGSLIMHMGALGLIGSIAPSNLIHVLLNNGCHESVGGQPTCAPTIDFKAVVLGCGYRAYFAAANESEIEMALAAIKARPGPLFLEIFIRKGSRADLGRPTVTPQQNRRNFMAHLTP